jgi:hypothetical protein
VNAVDAAMKKLSDTDTTKSKKASALHAAEEIVDPSNKLAFVYIKSGTYSFCEEKKGVTCTGNAVATGAFTAGLGKTGWDELSISTSASFTDEEQAHAAGFMEGSLTWERISAFYDAWVVSQRTPEQKARINKYVEDNISYVRHQVKALGDSAKALAGDATAKYWYTTGLVLRQLDGLFQGYNARTQTHKLTFSEILMINNDGDVMDLDRFVAPGTRFKQVANMSLPEVYSFLALNGHCTAIVKWTGDDLVMGHNSWAEYTQSLRIYKHLTFNYKVAKAKKVSFSSYPGMVYSSDDFYVMDSGLVVMETSLTILNEKLYGKNAPTRGVFTFIRSMVANLLAGDAPAWAEIFSQQNSGTYNNQWMVVDMNKFVPGTKTLSKDLFWVLEQIPGRVVAKDMTKLLQAQTYWGSFNRPFFKEINDESMFKHFATHHGEIFSYHSNSRARIIAREHANVKNVEDLQKLLRHNDYKVDPYSHGCPYRAIAARFDLPGTSQCPLTILKPNGATDAKVTSYKWRGQQKAMAINGPTTHNGIPPFSWNQMNGLFKEKQSPALPTTFNFSWQEMSPKTLPKSKSFV